MSATIHSIVFQPTDPDDGGLGRFRRVPVESAKLVADHGIEGDAKAGHNPRRQLNLLSLAWLEARGREGFDTAPGAFGEQLIVAGLEVEALERGARLRLGAEATVEITFPRTGCVRLDMAQGDGADRPVEADFSGRPIGMLARVVRGGTIRVGDAVTSIAADGADDGATPARPGARPAR